MWAPGPSEPLALVGGLVAAYLVARLVAFVIARRKRHQTFVRLGIAHTRPHPISGHLYETRRQPYVKFAHQMHKRLGKSVGMYLGGDPFLMTTDLELIQQVFVAKSRLFYDRMPFYLNVEPVPDNLICQRGERWRYMRRLLSPAFAHGRIKSSRFYLDTQRTYDKFSRQLDESARGAGATLVGDVYDRMAAIALDVICKTAFHMDDVISFEGPLGPPASRWTRGKRAEPPAASRDAFLATAKRACRLAFNPLVELIFCLPFLDPLLTYLCGKLYFHATLRLLLDRLDYLVRRPRLGPEPGRGPAPGAHQRRRIIDSLVEVLRERKITRSEFVGNALVIVFAGFETTANAFTFTLWLLAKHPEVQRKLRHQLRQRLRPLRAAPAGARLELELEELATGCEYLEHVVNESLRLYPPVPGLSCRQAAADCSLASGLRLERGVNVIPSVWSIHRDKTIWGPEAGRFRPERFEVLDVGQLNSAMFMPFGLGPRNCIGKALAMHELKIVIGRLVLGYSIEACAALTPAKLRICSPINITITSADLIGLRFVKQRPDE